MLDVTVGLSAHGFVSNVGCYCWAIGTRVCV